jgi:hypothetical protein
LAHQSGIRELLKCTSIQAVSRQPLKIRVKAEFLPPLMQAARRVAGLAAIFQAARKFLSASFSA